MTDIIVFGQKFCFSFFLASFGLGGRFALDSIRRIHGGISEACTYKDDCQHTGWCSRMDNQYWMKGSALLPPGFSFFDSIV